MTSPSNGGPEVVEEVEWIDPTPPQRPRREAPTPPEQQPSLKSLVETVVDEGKTYIQTQIALIKLKAQRAMGQAAGSIVMIVMAILFALLLLWWTFHTAEVALALVVPAWAAALIVWGILLLLVIAFGGIGVILALGAKNDAPNPVKMIQDDVEELKADLQSVKEGQDK